MQNNISLQEQRIKKIRKMDFKGLKSFFHLFASMAIAYCMCTLMHEFGHALAHMINGYHIRLIDVHPFDFNQCVPRELGAKDVFSGMMGPLSNVIVGTIIFLAVWKFRRPELFPLLLWGTFSYLEEGVGIMIEIILVYPQGQYADWMYAVFDGGLPIFVLGIIGVGFLLIGLFLFNSIYPLLGIRREDSYLKKTLITQGGIALYFLIAYFYVLKFNPSIQRVKLVVFIESAILSQILVTLHRPLAIPLNKLTNSEPSQASWLTVGITLGIAGVVITVLMSTYHWFFI